MLPERAFAIADDLAEPKPNRTLRKHPAQPLKNGCATNFFSCAAVCNFLRREF